MSCPVIHSLSWASDDTLGSWYSIEKKFVRSFVPLHRSLLIRNEGFERSRWLILIFPPLSTLLSIITANAILWIFESWSVLPSIHFFSRSKIFTFLRWRERKRRTLFFNLYRDFCLTTYCWASKTSSFRSSINDGLIRMRKPMFDLPRLYTRIIM